MEMRIIIKRRGKGGGVERVKWRVERGELLHLVGAFIR